MNKPNGYNHGSKQNLTGGLDFFTVYTTANITPTGVRKYTSGTFETNYQDQLDLTDAATASQYNLDKLIQIISTRGQPVFISGISSGATVPSTVTDFTPAEGATVYTLQFATEHNFSWDVDLFNTPVLETLAATLNGVGGFVYTGTAGAATNTVSIVKTASYSNDYDVNIQMPATTAQAGIQN